MAICAPTEAFAASLFGAIGRPELREDPKFKTRDARVGNVAELDGIVQEFTAARSMAQVVAELQALGVPAAEVRTPDAAVRDPQVVARRETVRLSHPQFGQNADVFGPGLPIVFSGSSTGYDQPAPGLGEHNDLIYTGLLGYSAEKMEALRSKNVI